MDDVDEGVTLSVQGKAIEGLLDNVDLDSTLITYYTYKRKMGQRKPENSWKYLKFQITPPSASVSSS